MAGRSIYLKEMELKIALDAIEDKITVLDKGQVKYTLGDVADKMRKKIEHIKYYG